MLTKSASPSFANSSHCTPTPATFQKNLYVETKYYLKLKKTIRFLFKKKKITS